MLTDKKR